MNDRSQEIDRHPRLGLAQPGEERWQDLPDAIKYGDVCYQGERYADALEAYTRVLDSNGFKQEPRSLQARLHYRIAGCHLRRSHYRLALEHLELARKLLPRHREKIQLARIYGRRGFALLELGQYSSATRCLNWAKKILSGTNDHEELASVEMSLGTVFARLGRGTEASQSFLSALTIYRRMGDRQGEARALNNLGLQSKNACEWREAVRYLEDSKTLLERLGNRLRLISANLNLGIVRLKIGKWELCEENLLSAEQIAREVESKQSLVRIHLSQANLALRRCQWERAEGLYREALTASREEGYAREAILAREFLGEMYLAQGKLDESEHELEAALAAARDLAPGGDLPNEILRRLAEVRLAQGRAEQALELAKQGASAASRIGDRYEEAITLRVVGLAMMAVGKEDEGERLVQMSLDSLSEIGESFQKGNTHLAFGRTLARRALATRSLDDLERAAVQFQRAYGAYLDLDARVQAATAAYERADLERRFERFEEAASYRAKAMKILPPRRDPELEAKLGVLSEELEQAFTERWSSEDDVLTSLEEMKRLFQGAAGTDAVLKGLIRLAVRRSSSSRGLVADLGANGKPRVVAAFGWPDREAGKLLHALGDTVRLVLSENRPLWTNNAGDDERFRAIEGNDAFRTRSAVLIPLTFDDDKVGLLYVDKTSENVESAYHQGELHLLTILANLAALSRRAERLYQENVELRAKIPLENGDDQFVTSNPELQETLRLATKVANSPVSILIEGETGTGKGLLAQVIHNASNRRTKPFVQINCAALPEQLLESELFGHTKGAFTGASYNKVGLFKEAEDGTLFLDEVDKTSPAVQAKLLHVLDSKEVRPVGSVKFYRVDTRVICATNTNLKRKIRDGGFLEDLYYRLNDFVVWVPPLRDRREDIPLLMDYFLEKFVAQYGRSEVRLIPEVRRVLLDQPWRGNVRELEKTIRRLVVLADDELPVGTGLLPVELQGGDVSSLGVTLREEVSRTERRVISDALRANKWNKAQVARVLKVSYPCLLKKIKEHALEKPVA